MNPFSSGGWTFGMVAASPYRACTDQIGDDSFSGTSSLQAQHIASADCLDPGCEIAVDLNPHLAQLTLVPVIQPPKSNRIKAILPFRY